MKRQTMLLACLTMVLTMGAASFPEVTETPQLRGPGCK